MLQAGDSEDSDSFSASSQLFPYLLLSVHLLGLNNEYWIS